MEKEREPKQPRAVDFQLLGDTERTSFTLPRINERPIFFEGQLLAKGSSQTVKGRNSKQWHEVALYQTEGGKYVVYVAYRTNGYYEPDAYDVWVLDAAAEVAPLLLDYDPTQYAAGISEGVQGFEEKQQELDDALCGGYDAIVASLLASSSEFAERVD